ncbi:MAG: transposase, partial [Candidatus Nitrotoga sp.]
MSDVRPDPHGLMQHMLPSGFKRIRHYGLLGPAHKTANLAAACAAFRQQCAAESMLWINRLF